MARPDLMALDLAPRGEQLYRPVDDRGESSPGNGGSYQSWCEEEHRPALGTAICTAAELARRCTRAQILDFLTSRGVWCSGGESKRSLGLTFRIHLTDTWCPWRRA